MYTYAEALQLLSEGKKISRVNSQNVWHLQQIKADGTISTVDVITRVNHKNTPRTRAPWAANTGDILEAQYVILDDESSARQPVAFTPGSAAAAFNALLNGATIRRKDWAAGMSIQLTENHDRIALTLPSGTEAKGEFHPDHFDVMGTWEIT